jgi:hypothetical protein
MYLPEGTILDVADDPSGQVLRDVFPEHSLIPDCVKTAMDLSLLPELGDEHFALVFENDGQVFRKFAHPDAGHTVLSTAYFLKTAHLFPEVAQKLAATRLVEACELYGLAAPTELLKMAAVKESWNPIGTVATLGNVADTAQTMMNNRRNLKYMDQTTVQPLAKVNQG